MYRDSTNYDKHSMKKENNCTLFPESLKSLENEAFDDALLNKCRCVKATITQTSTAIQEPMKKKRKVCKVFPMIFDYKLVSENIESKLDQRVGNERLKEGNVCKVFPIESENKSVSENIKSKLDQILKEENVFPQAYFAKGLVCGTKQGILGDEANIDNYSLAPLSTILHNVHQSSSYLHTFDQNSARDHTLTESNDTHLNDSFSDTVDMEPYDPLEPFAITEDVPLALRRHQFLNSGEPSFETLALHHGRLPSFSDCAQETVAKGPHSTSSRCPCGTLALPRDPFPELVKDSHSTECRSAALLSNHDSRPESFNCLCTTLALGHSSLPNFEHCSSESLALAQDSFQSARDCHSEVLELGHGSIPGVGDCHSEVLELGHGSIPGARDCHSEVVKLGHGSLPGVRDCHSEVVKLGHGSLPNTTDCPFRSQILHRDPVDSCSDNQSRIHEEQCVSSNGHQSPGPSASFSSGSNIFRPVPSNLTGQAIRLKEVESLERLSNQQDRQPSKRYYDPPVEPTQPLKRYCNLPVEPTQPLKRYCNPPSESTESLKRYYNPSGKSTQPMKRYYDPRGESIIPLKRYFDTPSESTPPLKRYYNPPTEYTQPLKRYYGPPSESIQPLKQYCNLHTKRNASGGCCCLNQNRSYAQMPRTSNDNSVNSFNDKCGNLLNRGVQSLGHFRSLTAWSRQQSDSKKETKRRKRYTFQNRFTSYSAHADYCRTKEDELAVHYLITKYLDKVE
ncbi:uncharacterized protein LOC121390570 [Gigantopelta aegis]|uniref:uncharacterized protein LOC121390570 n=1 Tax=Gigantopelta aegis TaxID=1735272 RepID=UPI001B88DED9|nr:uncharacterized protein LOC121390570 [Gigantopelta aegis]